MINFIIMISQLILIALVLALLSEFFGGIIGKIFKFFLFLDILFIIFLTYIWFEFIKEGIMTCLALLILFILVKYFPYEYFRRLYQKYEIKERLNFLKNKFFFYYEKISTFIKKKMVFYWELKKKVKKSYYKFIEKNFVEDYKEYESIRNALKKLKDLNNNKKK